MNNEKKDNKNKRKILIIILLLILILLLCIGGGFVLYRLINKEKQEDGGEGTTTTVTTTEIQEEPQEEIPQKIVFIREFDDDTSEDNELWISNWDGTEMESLGIKGVIKSYNGNSNGWIYYQKRGTVNAIHAYNLISSEQKVLEDSEPSAHIEYVSVPRKGDIIVYRVNYYGTDEEDLEVWLDPYPESKAGYHSYNIESEESVYLGNFRGMGGWDSDSAFFYISDVGLKYHEYDLTKGYYKIDVVTGEAYFLEEKVKECDVKYYMEEKDLAFIYRCGEGNGSRLIVEKDGVEEIIEDVETADIQPNSLWISPNRDYAVYIKAHHWEMYEGHYYDLILLNLSDLTTTALMLPEGSESYVNVIWLDESQFVTLLAKGEIPAEERDLVLVNIETNEKKQITSTGDISYFFY